jgi:fatty acid desaturase
MLWASVAFSLPTFGIAAAIGGWMAIILTIMGCIPPTALIWSYLYFAFKKPDYLRSEEHQWRMRAFETFGDKDNPVHPEAGDVVDLATNPSLPAPVTVNAIEQ